MEVLIVNCCEGKSFEAFRQIVCSSISKVKYGVGSEPNFIIRRMDELSDYVCHWHHDVLDEKSKAHMIKFDKLDMIFLYGDMSMVPWDPLLMQVITLCFMAHHCNKALFGCGSCAHVVVHTIATQGTRFHVLNGPHGGSISDLPRFPRYSFGTGPFPSGWLDNQTGDLYVYDKDRRVWKPHCNIGMYRLAAGGRPVENKWQQAPRHFARETRKLTAVDPIEALEEHEQVCHVRNEYLQHYSVRTLSSQEFVAPPLQNWYLNHECALPPGLGLRVVACGPQGPVILSQEHLLMVGIELSSPSGVDVVRAVVQNFVRHSIFDLERDAPNFNLSLFVHIFGEKGLGNGKFDSLLDARPLSPPLASKHVRSLLPKGPTFVNTPVYGLFFKDYDGGTTFDLTSLMSPRSGRTFGRQPINVLRDPQMNHLKRMNTLLSESGYKGLEEVCRQVVEQVTAEEQLLTDGFLDSTKAAMAGRIIHTNNIRARRVPTFVARPEGSSQDMARKPSVRGAVKGADTFILSSAPVGVGSMQSRLDEVHMNRIAGNSTAYTTTNTSSASQCSGEAHSSEEGAGGHVPHQPQSRRPSSAGMMPRHHPKIKKPEQKLPSQPVSTRRKTIYFVDGDDDLQQIDQEEVGDFRPTKTELFVQPARVVHVSRKSSTMSAMTKS